MTSDLEDDDGNSQAVEPLERKKREKQSKVVSYWIRTHTYFTKIFINSRIPFLIVTYKPQVGRKVSENMVQIVFVITEIKIVQQRMNCKLKLNFILSQVFI